MFSSLLDTACEVAFDSIAELTAQLTGCPLSCVSLTDSDRQWFKARHGTEMPGMPREHSFCAHAILDPTRTLVVPDLRNDARFVDNPFVMGDPNTRFYAGAPLVNPEGAALGTLCVLDLKPRCMSTDQRHVLTRLAATFMTTLELRRAVRRLHRLASTDPLTGLANRAALIDALDQTIARARRRDQSFGLLYLDLDGFKRVNDSFGHAKGDAVLLEVARVLTERLGSRDVAARLGGDEFAVLLTDAATDVQEAALRARSDVENAMTARGWMVTASVGAVAFRQAPQDSDEALATADASMYAAKSGGKNRMVLRSFSPSSRPQNSDPAAGADRVSGPPPVLAR